jgi:hypothetical protein
MRITIVAMIALAIGITAGVYGSWREFSHEKLPTKMLLAVLDERESSTPQGQGPKVVVEGGEIFDFGTMDRGSSGKHDFVFRNAGNEPLVLTMGETTCKCTAMSSGGKAMKAKDQETIPPGGSFTVTLEWGIKVTEKSFSQSAEFTTNDPRRETVRLLIHGRTVNAIEPADERLVFPNISANAGAVADMFIYSHRDQELKILKHEWTNADSKEFLDVAFLPLPDGEAAKRGARGGVRMRVAVKPGLRLGKTLQHITLSTNYEGIENLVIPVEINVVGDITLMGPKVRPGTTTVVLGTVDQKEGLTHTVYLLVKGPHRDQTAPEIVEVVPSDSLRATLGEPLTDSPTVKRIPITLKIPKGALRGNFLGTSDSKTGRIVLKTNHPQVKEIVIPVMFLVQ